MQQDPGGEEHLSEKQSAARTQTLIVKPHLDWIHSLMGSGEVRLKALLQNLHKWSAQVEKINFGMIRFSALSVITFLLFS